jgi:hypothetical protein
MKNQQKIVSINKELHQRLLFFKALKEFKNLSQVIEYCLDKIEEK